jgi:hypothetical protein
LHFAVLKHILRWASGWEVMRNGRSRCFAAEFSLAFDNCFVKVVFLTSYCSGVDIGGSDCSTMNRERSRKCERLRKCEILRI